MTTNGDYTEAIADQWYIACADAQLQIERIQELIRQLPDH